jgi:hypothetical protein
MGFQTDDSLSANMRIVDDARWQIETVASLQG